MNFCIKKFRKDIDGLFGGENNFVHYKVIDDTNISIDGDKKESIHTVRMKNEKEHYYDHIILSKHLTSEETQIKNIGDSSFYPQLKDNFSRLFINSPKGNKLNNC
jgi:hypothetical protein